MVPVTELKTELMTLSHADLDAFWEAIDLDNCSSWWWLQMLIETWNTKSKVSSSCSNHDVN